MEHSMATVEAIEVFIKATTAVNVVAVSHRGSCLKVSRRQAVHTLVTLAWVSPTTIKAFVTAAFVSHSPTTTTVATVARNHHSLKLEVEYNRHKLVARRTSLPLTFHILVHLVGKLAVRSPSVRRITTPFASVVGRLGPYHRKLVAIAVAVRWK